jgi:hypothetical protein
MRWHHKELMALHTHLETWSGPVEWHDINRVGIFPSQVSTVMVILPDTFININFTAKGNTNLWNRQTSFAWPTGHILCRPGLEDVVVLFNNDFDMPHAAIQALRKVWGTYYKNSHLQLKLILFYQEFCFFLLMCKYLKYCKTCRKNTAYKIHPVLVLCPFVWCLFALMPLVNLHHWLICVLSFSV